MRVLHFNTYDFGGAFKGAYRVHTALLKSGIDSVFSTKTDVDSGISKMRPLSFTYLKPSFIFEKATDFILTDMLKKSKPYFTISILPTNLNRFIRSIAPDIIHFHWITKDFISLYAMQKIASLNVPTVWTVRDAWPFTGGCHVLGDCQKWKSLCNKCPCFDKENKFDIVRQQFLKKKETYRKLNPYIVVLSRIFESHAIQSPLLNRLRMWMIPNPVDTKIFRPIERKSARQILGLDFRRRYILFGAPSSTHDQNKGYDLLLAALQNLPKENYNDLCCLVFGASAGENNTPFPIRFLGNLHDEITLVLAYSAADVFVCPSREESFSNTTLESLSCGTPVAAFAVGGIPDMIDHRVNGMLAAPHDPHELAEGIAYILARDDRRRHMGKAAREKVLQQYDMSVVARKYVSLYEDLLNSQGGQC
jgi:Glycosyltransferase